MPHRIRLSEEIRDLEGDLSYAECAKMKTEPCWYSGAADFSRQMNSIDQVKAGEGYIWIEDVLNCVSSTWTINSRKATIRYPSSWRSASISHRL